MFILRDDEHNYVINFNINQLEVRAHVSQDIQKATRYSERRTAELVWELLNKYDIYRYYIQPVKVKNSKIILKERTMEQTKLQFREKIALLSIKFLLSIKIALIIIALTTATYLAFGEISIIITKQLVFPITAVLVFIMFIIYQTASMINGFIINSLKEEEETKKHYKKLIKDAQVNDAQAQRKAKKEAENDPLKGLKGKERRNKKRELEAQAKKEAELRAARELLKQEEEEKKANKNTNNKK